MAVEAGATAPDSKDGAGENTRIYIFDSPPDGPYQVFKNDSLLTTTSASPFGVLSILEPTEVGDRFAFTFEGVVPPPPGPPTTTDTRGVVGNVLLYIPLGLLIGIATVGRRRRFIGPWMIAGLVASAAIGAGQQLVAGNLNVVGLIAHSAGYVVGYWLVVAGVRMSGLDLRKRLGIGAGEEGEAKAQGIAVARFFSVGVYLFVALLPFNVMFSLEKIYAQLVPNGVGKVWIILDPRYHLSRWEENGIQLAVELLALVPIGFMTAWLGGIKGRISLVNAVFSTVVVAVFCEFCQLLIASRTTDIILVPLAVLAGVVGWGAAKLWIGLQNVDTRPAPSRNKSAWRAPAVLLIGYMCVISFFTWRPYRFEATLGAVRDKILYLSNLLPFKDHLTHRNLGSAIDVVKEFGLFVPVGVLVAWLLVELAPNRPRLRVVVLSGVTCSAIAVITEFAQSITLGRFMDVTDVFLASAGGVAGALLLTFIRSVRVVHGHTGPPKDGRHRRRRTKRVRRYW